MSDNLNEANDNRIPEPICIDARRIYDSCGDKDCMSDLPVLVSTESQTLIDNAANVRLRGADVIDVLIDIEPVPFNRGFYSIDITYYFGVTLDVYSAQNTPAQQVPGLCISDKKVILYGSEGSVRVFSSDMAVEDYDAQNASFRSLPTANVQVAKPIALAVDVQNTPVPAPRMNYNIPDSALQWIGGDVSEGGTREALATLGVFSIVQLLRSVQMLIPSYDFCIPEKRCEGSTDSPCDMFARLEFPTDEFFPPNVADPLTDSVGCSCDEE